MESLLFTHMFPYSDIQGIEGLRPIIPVVFVYNDLEFTFPMLIDTGADATSLPPEQAAGLGIDITNLTEYKGLGAGGPFKYRRLEGVKLIIVEEEIEITVPVHFNESMIRNGFGLLGREVVFDSIRVAFRQCKAPYVYMALEGIV